MTQHFYYCGMNGKSMPKQIPVHLVDQKLRDLLKTQFEESVVLESIDDRVKFFSAFSSARFETLYDEAVDSIKSHKSLAKFEHIFAGRVFEYLAFMYLQSCGWGPVLSPKKSLEFYRWLYPYDIFIDNRMGDGSLEGIIVPDGLMLEEQKGVYKIIAVCEYTTRGELSNISRKKLHGFRINRRHFPLHFGDSQLLFVVPAGNGRLQDVESGDAAVEYVPFSAQELRRMGDYFLDKANHEGEPSIRALLTTARSSRNAVGSIPEDMYAKSAPLRVNVQQILDSKRR